MVSFRIQMPAIEIVTRVGIYTIKIGDGHFFLPSLIITDLKIREFNLHAGIHGIIS